MSEPCRWVPVRLLLPSCSHTGCRSIPPRFLCRYNSGSGSVDSLGIMIYRFKTPSSKLSTGEAGAPGRKLGATGAGDLTLIGTVPVHRVNFPDTGTV